MEEIKAALVLRNMFVCNEYFSKYLEIVSIPFLGKGEKHHILPRSIYPEYVKSTWNTINLSYNDHYRAHYYLTLCTLPEFLPKMIAAWVVMNAKGTKYNVLEKDAEDYAHYKQLQSKMFSGEGNPMWG